MWCDIQVRIHVDFILVILFVRNAVLLKFVSLPTAVFFSCECCVISRLICRLLTVAARVGI